ncbi:MAG: hypothetical protein EPN97_17730 [Alphaproteobacteria bacterium]|nr:MAG: hypothetical protein EPN97_17730 [Alphaproteobacteria bacterium]
MASCNLVKAQVVRGVIGAVALVIAYFLFQPYPIVAFVFIGLSALAMKGCPVCWIVETGATLCKVSDDKKKAEKKS